MGESFSFRSQGPFRRSEVPPYTFQMPLKNRDPILSLESPFMSPTPSK